MGEKKCCCTCEEKTLQRSIDDARGKAEELSAHLDELECLGLTVSLIRYGCERIADESGNAYITDRGKVEIEITKLEKY